MSKRSIEVHLDRANDGGQENPGGRIVHRGGRNGDRAQPRLVMFSSIMMRPRTGGAVIDSAVPQEQRQAEKV